jgi:hypothetical protein
MWSVTLLATVFVAAGPGADAPIPGAEVAAPRTEPAVPEDTAVPGVKAPTPPAAAAARPDWLASESNRIALINVKGPDQRATGFIVGWLPRTLYLVTARHVWFDENDHNATSVEVVLDASLCGQTLENVRIYKDDATYDMLVLAAEVPPACASRINELRSVALSSLTALNRGESPGPTLFAVGRAGNHSTGSVTAVHIDDWSPPKIMISPATPEETSGGPVFSSRGEIVGMLSRALSNNSQVFDFISILPRLRTLTVQPNLAGVFSELQLAGYPSGTTMMINGDEKNVMELAQAPRRLPLPPGPMRLSIRANGYDAADAVITIPDPGSVSRCVTLVRASDRIVAKMKWPLLVASVGLGGAGLAMAEAGNNAKDTFNETPSSAALDDANGKLAWARGLFIGGGVAGAFALAAFAWNGFALSPSMHSSIGSCQ